MGQGGAALLAAKGYQISPLQEGKVKTKTRDECPSYPEALRAKTEMKISAVIWNNSHLRNKNADKLDS